MKKIIFFTISTLISIYCSAQAPNFNSNDCNGTNYDLYTQLDAGKVIVVCWVMPCSTCIPGAKISYNVVQSFQSSNPNKVFLYLCDDLGDTPCASINSWANSNSIPASVSSLRFSNPIINMTNYGSTGMPKVAVFGGNSHTIIYSANGTIDGSAMQAAINNALIASGIEEGGSITSEINLFPNPVNNNLHLSINIDKQTSINIDIFNILGTKVYTSAERLNKGINKIDLNSVCKKTSK